MAARGRRALPSDVLMRSETSQSRQPKEALLHRHNFEHEDAGMMLNLEVSREGFAGT